MKLLSLTLSGFKSFAKPTELFFTGGLTAIIGPNGSGKSNIAEAIRWVLGEQSVKQLRGKSSQDVIFSGNDQVAAARRARVTLHLGNESQRFPLDAGEIAIERSVGQDGLGTYLLNSEAVRLADLQQMIAQAGFGTKSYTVISQGMVDKYVTASPGQRRELFDEATGVKALQLKIAETTRNIVASERYIQDLQVILQELQPRRNLLRRQAEKEARRAHLVQQFSGTERAWLQQQWLEHRSTLEQATIERVAVQNEAKKIGESRQSLEAELFSPKRQQLLQLEQEVRHLQAGYEQAMQVYRAQKDLLPQLEQQLQESQLALKEATLHLQQIQQESVQFDWLQQVRGMINQALEAIQHARQGSISLTDFFQSLEHILSSNLKRLENNAPVASAQGMLQHIEAPMKNVSRLEFEIQKIQEEIVRIQNLTKPDDEQVQTASNRLNKEQESVLSTQDISPQTLHRIHQLELSSNVKISQLEQTIHQLETEKKELEATILRTQGTAFLNTITQKEYSANQTQKVSKEEYEQLQRTVFSLGEPDMLAEKEFAEVNERYINLEQQAQDATESLVDIQKLLQSLKEEAANRFTEQFHHIQHHFSHYIGELFEGGTGEITIEEDGVDISVNLPGKRLHSLQAFSGGERSLIAIALLLATLVVQKPPFLVLDEVDAALDEANARRFAVLLADMSKAVQCIVITHNRETMSLARTLYGVAMTDQGISKVYSVEIGQKS